MRASWKRKALESLRDTLMDGAESLRDRARGIGFRSPVYRLPLRSTLVNQPLVIGMLAFIATLTGFAAYSYLRKRKQAADPYGMDAGEGEVPPAPGFMDAHESPPEAGRRNAPMRA